MPVENRICPACGNSNFSLFLNSRDYFLSGEEFSISQCDQCNLLVTSPVPDVIEIGKYYQSREYISHDSGQANLVSYIYKGARFFTLRSKYGIVKKFSTGNRLLDIGCGTGEFLNFCKQRGYDCKGIEPNQGAREFASGKYGLAIREKIEFSETEKSGFDCITLWHVLEHIHDPAETLAQLRAVLKPGGTLIIALPNPGSWDAR